MNPIIMINAGDYSFANAVMAKDHKLELWVPTKDKGADFLITRDKRTIARVQVKASRDYVSFGDSGKSSYLKASSWFWAKRSDLENPLIDLWSLVIVTGKSRHDCFYLNIPRKRLYDHLVKLHGKLDRYSVYVWALPDGRALLGRGVKNGQIKHIAEGEKIPIARDITQWLDNWRWLSEKRHPVNLSKTQKA